MKSLQRVEYQKAGVASYLMACSVHLQKKSIRLFLYIGRCIRICITYTNCIYVFVHVCVYIHRHIHINMCLFIKHGEPECPHCKLEKGSRPPGMIQEKTWGIMCNTCFAIIISYQGVMK